MFEKMYLSPQNAVKGDLRSTFGNPTPLALLGYLLSLSPLSCELMGWRGAGGAGIATTGAYYFIVSSLLPIFLANHGLTYVPFNRVACSCYSAVFSSSSSATPSPSSSSALSAASGSPLGVP